MKKGISLVAALATALAVSGCNAYNPNDRALGGAALGGATGAVIGGAASGTPGGALAGAAIGAASGAILGAATTPQPPRYRPRCAEFEVDYYGNRHCIAWYQP
jgi:hypothetical protein